MDGCAALCFPDGGEWFQGYFYVSSEMDEMTLGLFGVEIPVDDCVRCCHGGYREYELTIINYSTEQEARVTIQKTGGDFCILDSTDQGGDTSPAKLHFETLSMLTDEKACTFIRRAFPSISNRCQRDEDLDGCIVCIGSMHVEGIDLLT
ncbi:hypothetical protein AeRB84_016706 [Aphanomyces euteiches]|nr:hypothetical protein AeRB84_016706 [Aphanomyces euteiches]